MKTPIKILKGGKILPSSLKSSTLLINHSTKATIAITETSLFKINREEMIWMKNGFIWGKIRLEMD